MGEKITLDCWEELRGWIQKKLYTLSLLNEKPFFEHAGFRMQGMLPEMY